MLRSTSVLFWLLGLTVVALAGERPTLRVGVFDQVARGGQGARVDGLVRGLRAMGYEAEAFASLDMLALLDYDVVYLSDMHKPGRVHAEWRTTLRDFVAAGGSVLQTWHHHIFPTVSIGVRRVYGSRRMHVVEGHPAVEGVSDFDALFKDHIVERVGKGATVLLKNDAGDPVAAAGTLGKGKIVSTGLALAIPNGGVSAPPRGAERKLLEAVLAWLRPSIPRQERLEKAVRTPTLSVVPPEALVAAGFDAAFDVRVGSPEGAEVEMACVGAEADIEEHAQKTPGVAPEKRRVVRRFRVVVHTEPKETAKREVVVRATVGEGTLEQTVVVEAVYAKPPADEVRGVWLHVREDRHPKDVMPELKRLGITMAVLRIAGGTAAFFNSKTQPDVQDPLAPEGDWLAEAVRHAHAHGIEMHPYVNNCIVEGRTSKASLARLRKAGRLQQDPQGRSIAWFCPSQEANIQAMERVMLELVTRYEVDGVQYDFIRYPNASGCFCPRCRALFEQETAEAVAEWPKDVLKGGSRHAAWVEFRCRRISGIVERISTKIREAAPKVQISAAVFRNWPDCRESNGQDWARWCREGWLDAVFPMNYTLDSRLFAARAAVHRGAVPEGVPVIQGIGIRSSRGGMQRPEELAVQIALARRSGAQGFCGFCYWPGHTRKLFEPLDAWLTEE
ncbi:MAG: glycoside hydrolase family 10 protein [Planctomycetota bacterium]